jgi:uncharacterized protein
VTRVLAALALALLLVPYAGAQWEPTSEGLAPIPALTGRVVDLTSTLSAPDAQALTAKLAAWEQKTGNQLAVLIVPSTQPEPIEAYSIRAAEAWKIGRKGQDNGALLVIAKDDRKLRIEVGYGLEGSLTDATSKRIIAETIAPLFRENKFAQGINAGVDQIMAVVDKGEPLAARPQAKPSSPGGGFSFEMLLVLVFLVIPIMGGILRRIFGRFLGSTVGAGIIGAGAWLVMGSLLIAGLAGVVTFIILLVTSAGGMLARRGGGVWIPSGGWGGGGWGGGSGGGGFSGGGGGFGGGGASGNW